MNQFLLFAVGGGVVGSMANQARRVPAGPNRMIEEAGET